MSRKPVALYVRTDPQNGDLLEFTTVRHNTPHPELPDEWQFWENYRNESEAELAFRLEQAKQEDRERSDACPSPVQKIDETDEELCDWAF